MKFNFKKILIIILIIIIVALILLGIFTYLTSKGIIQKEVFWKNYGTAVVITSLGVLGVLIIVYLISKFVEKKKEKEPLESLKKIVGTVEAFRLWESNFIPESRLNYYYDYSERETKIKLADPDDYNVKDRLRFVFHNSPFLKFEISIKKGNYAGVHTVIIQLDLGEEWIMNNWNGCMIMNTPLMMHKQDNRNYPLTTPEDWNQQLDLHILELKEEGYSDERVKDLEGLRSKYSPTEKVESEEKQDAEIEALAIENAKKINERVKKNE